MKAENCLKGSRFVNIEFSGRFFGNMSMVVSNPEQAYPNSEQAWKKFLSLFATLDGLISFEPIFEAFFFQALNEFYNDNVQYIEFRSLFNPVTLCLAVR